METAYYVYMIETEKNRIYTGIAIDPELRFFEHLFDRKKGAKFFRSDEPIAIIYAERFKNRSLASKKEAAIKKLSRNQKIEMIKKQNLALEKDDY